MSDEQEFEPVEGESIPISGKKSLGLIGLAAVLFPVGVGLTWLWWTETTIPLIQRQITWWGALFGAVTAIASVLLPPVVLWQWLVRKERLVIGTEYLQVVVSRGGKDVVESQIGLDNIETVSLQKHMGNNVIAFDLHDIDAPDLLPADGKTKAKFKDQFGFHWSVGDAYQVSGKDLLRKIKTAMARVDNKSDAADA